MIKKLYIGDVTQVSLSILNSKHILIITKNLEKTFYISIPTNIYIKKEEKFLIINENENSCKSFSNRIVSLLTKKKLIKKKLILKGVGYKMSLSSDLKNIIFKLGYSHLIVLPIPQQIFNVSIIKNMISMQSYDLSFLGNFLAKIRSFRIPDAYKGKGFTKKNEKLILKQLKKK